MKSSEKQTCEHCGNDLQALNPPVEDYLEYKFCIKLFGWKLMLLKDHIQYGCTACLNDEQQSERRDNFDEAVSYAIQSEIEKGNLLQR